MRLDKNKLNVVIIGASGHAKVIIDIIEKTNNYNIVGLIDSFKPIGSSVYNYKIIGREKDIPDLKKTHHFQHGIIAIGDNYTRKTLYEKISKIAPNFKFINAIHPNAIVGKNVKIGKGVVIIAGAIINSDAIIGDFCIVNTKASLGHDSQLKKYSSLAPNCTIGGNVKIGTCSSVCMSSTVIQDIRIGKHCIVGAGSLIIRNVKSFTMVYGVPGKNIKEIKKGEKYLYHTENLRKKLRKSLEIITDKAGWTKTLSEIGNYDFYHTFDYHKISKAEGECPTLIVYRKNDVVIALPLLLRDIRDTGYKDATSAYGYVGPISKGVHSDFNNSYYIKALFNYFNENNIISVFSRLNPYIKNQSKTLKGLGQTTSQGKIVNIDLKLDKKVQRSNYRSRLKTHVNKSRRLCSIRKALNNEDLKTFMDIYHENMDRVNAKKSYYFDKWYFKRLINSTSFDTEILLAVDKETGKTIAGCMFVTTNNIVQYHLSGTKNDFLHLNATKLLIDEMRIIANEKGCEFYNLGGGLGGRDDDSLFDFKSSFSKDFREFNLWKLIVNENVYNNLVQNSGVDQSSAYFPLYRLADDIKVNL